jgi:hypothetical protein
VNLLQITVSFQGLRDQRKIVFGRLTQVNVTPAAVRLFEAAGNIQTSSQFLIARGALS